MNPIFFGKIKDGIVKLYDKRNFNIYLSSLEDKEIQVSIGLVKKNRSPLQNKYYWGCVIKLLCDVTGYTDEEMHEALKIKFLMDNTRQIPTVKSTALLTTVEFEDYLLNIRQWAAQDLSCSIPEPNEVEI